MNLLTVTELCQGDTCKTFLFLGILDMIYDITKFISFVLTVLSFHFPFLDFVNIMVVIPHL